MPTIGPIPLSLGWVSDADIWNCPPGGALTFYGFQPWGGSAIKTLDGVGSHTAQISGCLQLFGFAPWDIGSNDALIIAVVSTSGAPKIYTNKISNGTGAWTDRTGSVTTTGGTYSFDILNGNFLMFNAGVNSGFTTAPLVITSITGNAATLGGSPPLGNIVKVVNNFAFVGQVLASTSTYSTIYWSAVNDPTTWPAGNSIQFRNGDGDYVTALASIGSDLIIFKQHSMGSLSTTSTIISGAVALGPLTTISDKIGCVAPTAIDEMPDGSLVFLGADKHLYQTDGTVTIDLSGVPAPASNINFNLNYVSGAVTYGFNGAFGTYVKVDAANHRIFLLFTDPVGAKNPLYSYDYYYKTWSDWSELNDKVTGGFGNGLIQCLASMPYSSANIYGGSQGHSVWYGSDTGYLQTFNPRATASHKNSTTFTSIFETSIQLGSSSPPEFIPRQIVIPVSYTQSDNSTSPNQVQVYIGFDGTYAANPAYTGNPTSRMIVPVAELRDSSTLHPLTMQIKVIATNSSAMASMVLEPIYISDEVMG